MIRSISALTLFTADMARSVTFYEKMGFRLHYGGPEAAFTSFFVGTSYLNLTTNGPAKPETGWGRAIFHVDDVDACHARAVAAGYKPEAAPPRRPLGRTLLPHPRPRRPRAQLRAPAANRSGLTVS